MWFGSDALDDRNCYAMLGADVQVSIPRPRASNYSPSAVLELARAFQTTSGTQKHRKQRFSSQKAWSSGSQKKLFEGFGGPPT